MRGVLDDLVRIYVKCSSTVPTSCSSLVSLFKEVIFEDYTHLTDEDIERLLASDELTAFQKVSLEFAVQQGSPTHEHVVSLNKPANVDEVRGLMEDYTFG